MNRVNECPVCGKDRCYKNWCFRHRMKIYSQKDGTVNYGYYVNGREGIRLRRLSAKSEQEPQVPEQSSFDWQVDKVHSDPTA